MRGLHVAIALGGAFVPLAIPSAAFAQASASAEAAELFQQGRAALDAKDYAAACSKLAGSLKLERAVGTLISLAECEQASGRLAGARQHWREAADFADASGDALHRGPFARQKFTELDPRVPRLTVRLASGAPRDTTARRDDVDLGTAALDAPLPVDPGAHTLVATAPGHDARTLGITLQEGEQRTVEVEPGPAVALPPPVAAVQASPGASPPPRDAAGWGSLPLSITGFAVAGAGIALGSGFGLSAIAAVNSVKSQCSGNSCPPSLQGKADGAATQGTLSTVCFAVAGAGAVLGVVMLPSWGSRPASTALRLGVGPGSISATGEF